MSAQNVATFISSIPDSFQRDLIYHCRVYLGRNVHHDIVLTQGPILYEIRRKQILSSCDLSNTLLAGTYPVITAENPYRNSNIKFEVKFSYSSEVRQILYFLKINRDFAILGKRDSELVVLRELSNVEEYETFDENNTGEMSLCMQTSSFSDVANIQLNALLLKDIAKTDNTDDLSAFEGIHKAMTNRLAEARVKLAEAKQLLQKSHTHLAKELQFSLNNTEEECLIMAKYGDIWVRNVNDKLVIGIPIYNCSFERKCVAQNIRVSLYCPQQSQLRYDANLYQYTVQHNKIVPTIAELTGNDDDDNGNSFANHPSFEQEWTVNQNAVLFADAAAIIVVTIDLMDFAVLSPACVLDCFVQYDVVIDSTEPREFQLYAGRVHAEPNILYEKRFRVSFEEKNVHRDLLAVAATSAMVLIELTFNGLADGETLETFFIQKLQLSKVKKSPTSDDNFLNVSQIIADPEATNLFFSTDDNGFWAGTLIRIKREVNNRRIKLKIYNGSKVKLVNCIQTIRSGFGRRIEIEPSVESLTVGQIELELKHRFKEEAEYFRDMAKSMADNNNCKAPEVLKMCEEFAFKQFQTDLAYMKL